MKKVLTIILDGFGMKEDVYGNPVKNAGMTNFINIWKTYPHALLKCSEKSLGFSEGEKCNSEIGHKIIGSGRKVKNKNKIMQEAINKNILVNSPKYQKMLRYLKEKDSNIHLMFLLSEDSLLSNPEDLKNIIQNLKANHINNIYLHIITDGEDSSKFFSLNFFKQHSDDLSDYKIASICGKYYALDNTGDYTKTEVYYDLLMNSKGVNTPSIERIIKLCYDKKITDAYLPPIKTKDFMPLQDGDVLLFLNYSKSNQYQIIDSLTSKEFDQFAKERINIKVFSLFEINQKLNYEYILMEKEETNTLCEYIGKVGLTQARISEEVKEDSITYYLDGARDIKIENCENFILKSNKIEFVEKKPEMKALNIAKVIVKCMENDYDMIFANFPNPDTIGHTGNFQATINALQAIDVCLGKLIEVANENFYKIIILGSHANCDTIINRDNEIITGNTDSPVPFIILDKSIKLKNGTLDQVAPTILNYIDITIPKEMKNSETLIEES